MRTISKSDTTCGPTARAHSSIYVHSVVGVAIGRAVLIDGGCDVGTGNERYHALPRPRTDNDLVGAAPVRIGDATSLGVGAAVACDVKNWAVQLGLPAHQVGTRA